MRIYITRYGAKLRVKDGMFVVSYLDQEKNIWKQEYAPVQVKSIWLFHAATLSVSVLELAAKHQVDIVFTDKRGNPLGRFHPHRPFTTSLVQKAQSWMSHHPARYEYIIAWIGEKIFSQIAFLEKLQSGRSEENQQFLQLQIDKLKSIAEKLAKIKIEEPGELAGHIRGLEGVAGRIFYPTLGKLLIPRYQFTSRSRQPAQDAFNAFLNYGFGLLYSKIERALVLAGINPYVGFLHRDGYQFKSMVYDFIEPFRTDMVNLVFRLFSRQKVILSRHISQEENGIWLIEPGKRLIIRQTERMYTSDRILWEGYRISKEDWINRRAQLFAKSMVKSFKESMPSAITL